jgi:hypothetical protein
MYTYTIRSKYKMGAWVTYSSKYNGSGEGKIVGIAYNDDESIYYMIEGDGLYTTGGITPDDVVSVLSDGQADRTK